MWCAELLGETLLFHHLFMLKIQQTQTPKDNLTNLLEAKKVTQGTHVVYQNTNDEGGANLWFPGNPK